MGKYTNNLYHKQTDAQWASVAMNYLACISCPHISVSFHQRRWRVLERVLSLTPQLWARQFQYLGLSLQFLTCYLQTVHLKISNNTWLKKLPLLKRDLGGNRGTTVLLKSLDIRVHESHVVRKSGGGDTIIYRPLTDVGTLHVFSLSASFSR